MDRGLAGLPSSLRMIPTFIDADPDVAPGEPVIAVDAGGTNLRVAVVRFGEDGAPHVSEFAKLPMPGHEREITADEFFAVLADCLRGMLQHSGRIGFSFSYPAEIQPNKDGRIIGLWKELKVKDAAGRLVGEGLEAALRERGVVRAPRVVVLNDTVGALLAGRTVHGARRYSAHIGFVLGTGTNCSYVESNERITRRRDLKRGARQVINLESGAFSRIPRGAIDLAFDAGTSDPGVYVLEKAVSGAYLGGLCRHILKAAVEAGVLSCGAGDAIRRQGLETRELEAFLEDEPGQSALYDELLVRPTADDAPRARELVDLTVERAAKLAAVSMAAVLSKSGGGGASQAPVCVTVEGSTFYGIRSFKRRVTSWVDAILERRVRYEIAAVENAALIGAAACGLTN
jgi:hexokinase